jgi:hypothetical protein
MLETAESWESFWSITAQAWTRPPAEAPAPAAGKTKA